MKRKEGYIIRTVADEIVVVPTGEEAIHFNGLISLNKTGKVLFEALEKDTTIDALVRILTERFDVEEEVAKKDIEDFIDLLVKEGLMLGD